jgi:hypothetical protein
LLKGVYQMLGEKTKYYVDVMFLCREALAAKTIGQEPKFVFNYVIKTLNCIKSKPPRFRLFAKLCEEVGSQYVNHTLHVEMF